MNPYMRHGIAIKNFNEFAHCPQNGLPQNILIQTFYNGVTPSTRGTIDAMAGGSLLKKTTDDAIELLEEMADNNSIWPTKRTQVSRSNVNHDSSPSSSKDSVKKVHELDPLTMMQAQISALAYKIDNLNVSKSTSLVCENYGQNGHISKECNYNHPIMEEQVNYVQGQVCRPYSNNYNAEHRNFPNTFWRNHDNQDRGNQVNQSQDKIGQLTNGINQKMSSQDDSFKWLESKFDKLFKNHSSSIHNLKVQVGQLANAISSRGVGNLPSNTKKNPRENVSAIILRCGKVVDKIVPSGIDANILNNETIELVCEPSNEVNVAGSKEKEKEKDNVKAYQPSPPFPQRIKKQDTDKQFLNFIDKLKHLHINMSFMEAITQIPNYRKFLKDLISKKYSWEDACVNSYLDRRL
ncbi:uncharacterized protein LOC105628914 [Jatropha curcas]|uniref:uncharacterized protein LOC105628914 n=1 Tax=Jatropha curcas TaxID=180498 RepID=UPI0018942694|nr:uncharacterized protein LOC105628914 [Jatropha curcas]